MLKEKVIPRHPKSRHRKMFFSNILCAECKKDITQELNARRYRGERNWASRKSVLKRTGKTFCSNTCSRSFHGRLSSLRMTERNPMESPKTRAKMSASLKRIGHRPKVHGGNGRGMTIPQAILLEELGDGWFPELAVPTKEKRESGFPTCYKIDLASPQLMIGIEVDGGSHESPSARRKDEKKRALLHSLGWTVLRFWNEDVLNSFPSVMAGIMSTISKLKTTITTSRMASSSTIATPQSQPKAGK